MKEVPCDVPDIVGKKIVGISKVISDSETERVVFRLNDGSKLVFGKEDGFLTDARWVSRASVKYGDREIDRLLF